MDNRQPHARQRREVHYSGHVQGVGFRYTVERLAKAHAVAGFVRNLADGRVQMVVDGDPAALDELMAAIADRMSGYIRDAAVDVRQSGGDLVGFEIRTTA